ncbi:MAG: RNA polymerase sigma factor [Phycisphaerae bacterium]
MTSDFDESTLVAQVKAGDRDAFITLLSTAGPKVREVIKGMIAPGLQAMLSADDVMQQAYTDAFLCIQRFSYDGSGSFERWLTTLAKRNCVDAVRSLTAAKRGGAHERFTSDESDVNCELDIVARFSATPSRFAVGDEARLALEAALRQLPDLYADVVRRLDLNGEDVASVAAELNRSKGAVYMLRARAHDQLREALGSASRFFSSDS